MTKEQLREAYDIVLADLMSNCGGLPIGKYDAVNGSAHYMYGIWLIMETIADKAEKREILNAIFANNMDLSEEKARAYLENKDDN